ncbi:MAG: AAA family ATPase [Rhodospirillales bacterium]
MVTALPPLAPPDSLIMPGRPLPHDLPSERAMVGTVICYPRCLESVRAVVCPDDIGYVPLRRVYEATVALADAEGLGDDAAHCLHRRLRGDQDALGELDAAIDHAGAWTSAPRYAAIVRDDSDRRRMLEVADRAFDPSADMDEALAEIARLAARPNGSRRGYLDQVREATERLIATSGNPPAIPWLIDRWVPERDTTLVAGPGGGGKSYLVLQLQAAAAVGGTWLGLPVPRCSSLGFYSEDGFEAVATRLDAIARHYRTTVADLMEAGLRVLPRPSDTELIAGRAGEMTTTAAHADLRRAIDRLRPTILILDNVADFLPVLAFDNAAIRQARRIAIDPLCAEFGVTIVGLQNVTLAGMRATDEAAGSSGGLAWRDAFRARLYLRTDEAAEGDDQGGSRGRILSRIKANNAPDDGEAIKLRWSDGVFTVDAPAIGTVAAIERRNKEAEAEDAFLTCLREVRASGRYAAHSTASRDHYAPKLFRTLAAGKAHSMKALKEAMERLFAAGRIRVESVLNANRNYVSAIVEIVAS